MQAAIEAMLAAAIILIPLGVGMVQTGKVFAGLAVVIVGVGIIFLRSSMKA